MTWIASRQAAATAGGWRRREEERAGALDQDVAQVLRAGDVAAEDADGLAQRPDLDRDAAVEPEVVDRAAAVAPEDARGVGVVDEDRRVGRLGRLDDPGQRGDVAVHAEHAVGDDEDQPVRQPGALAAVLDRLVAGSPRRASTSACG